MFDAIERLPFGFSVCERGTGREVTNLSFLIINERRGARLLPTLTPRVHCALAWELLRQRQELPGASLC